eukprot:scaffold3178_cov19-Tisochrysis_lutea.AAC.2
MEEQCKLPGCCSGCQVLESQCIPAGCQGWVTDFRQTLQAALPVVTIVVAIIINEDRRERLFCPGNTSTAV